MLIAFDDARRLRGAAPAAEAAGWLLPEQIELIHERDWLRLLAPQAVGGAEWALPAIVRLEEELAAIDGSLAWTVTLCAGAGFFAGFLPPAFARELMATPRVCLAGSGAVGGLAEQEGEGWRLRGEWLHASGAPMATHFTVNARLQKRGQALLDAQGEPRVEAFVLPAAQVRLLDSWHPLGLRATASQGFVIEDQWLADRQRFRIVPEAATSPGPLYRFPFSPLAYTTLAANLAGIARGFLELAAEPLERPRARHLQARREQAIAALQAAREHCYALLDAGWARVEGGELLHEPQADAINQASRTLVAAAQRAVNAVYPLCGLQAADQRSPLNRAWRDFHTATQHAIWLPQPSDA